MRTLKTSILLFNLPVILLLTTLGCEELDPCKDTDLYKSSFDDASFNVGVKFRVEVKDSQDAVVQGANVRIEYWKVHCEGHDSQHFLAEGETGDEGIFTTELQPVYTTFYISNSRDYIRVELTVWKEGWSHSGWRNHAWETTKELPTRPSDPNEHQLLDSYTVVYTGP
jgi:hypothetical protein